MIARKIQEELAIPAREYKFVTITGPRQKISPQSQSGTIIYAGDEQQKINGIELANFKKTASFF